MGYYLIFQRFSTTGQWLVYHDLVREYRHDFTDSKPDDKYWKEREDKGLFVTLQWLCDTMEMHHKFDLIFLSSDYAVFKKRTWIQNLAKRLGFR